MCYIISTALIIYYKTAYALDVQNHIFHFFTFSTSHSLNFNYQNRAPREDIEARDLNFFMRPSFTLTHTEKKYEIDPRPKMQFRTVYYALVLKGGPGNFLIF